MRFLRRSPLLYDASKALKRAFGITTPLSRFLDRFSRDHGGEVHFVQVGANDGLRRDPLPGAFQLLRDNYRRVPSDRLTFVNAAVSAGEEGLVPFWTIAPAAVARLPLEERLHLLAVDVEGYDLTLLRSIDFAEFAPEAILYETQNLGADEGVAREFLEGHGYRVVPMGEDAVAVREEIPA